MNSSSPSSWPSGTWQGPFDYGPLWNVLSKVVDSDSLVDGFTGKTYSSRPSDLAEPQLLEVVLVLQLELELEVLKNKPRVAEPSI